MICENYECARSPSVELMQLSQLRLKNFKIFRDQRFKFRPLTLLTGPNSSGKSTVLKAIGAVLQTQRPQLFPFNFSLNGKNCSLGGFRNLAHGGGTRQRVTVGLTIQDGVNQLEIEGAYRFSPSGQEVLPATIQYVGEKEKLQIRWKGQKLGYQVRVESAFFRAVGFEKAETFATRLVEMLSILVEKEVPTGESAKSSKDFQQYWSKQARQEGKWFSLKPRGGGSNLLDELRRQEILGSAMASQVTSIIDRLIGLFSYVGPVRSHPSRYYLHQDENVAIDPTGAFSMLQLFKWKRQFPKKYREVIRLMKLLEMASVVDTAGRHGEALQVNIQPWKHEETVNVVDVGFGVSQVLPLIVKDVALPPSGTLLVDQPEVHLHPSSQALLADYFASRLKERRYIIETHSEYLINRLRLLTAKQIVKGDDVSILYFEPRTRDRKHIKVHEITIGENGSLDSAPKSFFETYYSDTYGLAMTGF